MGYKSEQFVKPVDENLFCSICHEVFQDPVSCKDGHTFCNECIEQWLKTNKKCPLDNSKITDNKLPRNYIVKGIIDNLAVFCYYPDDDESKNDDSTQAQVEEKCSWTGKLQEVAKHRDVCGFQLAQCTHPKCTLKEQRRRIVDHMKTCKFKVIVCASCRVTMIQNDKDLHEKEYCPKTLVICPKGCLTPSLLITTVRRMDLDEHLRNDCTKTILDCPFMNQGCSVQVERQHVDKHVQDNMAAHMMLLAKQCSSLTKKNSSLTEQNTVVTEECCALTKKCSTLEKNCSSLTEQYSTLEKTCSTLTNKCSPLEKNCSSLTEQCSTLKKNCSSLTDQCSTLEKNCSSLSEQYSTLEKKCSLFFYFFILFLTINCLVFFYLLTKKCPLLNEECSGPFRYIYKYIKSISEIMGYHR